MCGIAGIVNFDGEPSSPVLIRRMTDALAHRGPDGEGFFVEGPVALGHRRLAIIDLSPAGHQPMLTQDGEAALTYNGELYNHQELRLELEARGHTFRSRTDSEVVLHALREWGTEALLRFNGMFALAYYDRKRRELLLARDRYGIKPLYVTTVGNTLLFGSEVKAFLAYPEFKCELDRAGLVEYMTFQNFLTDRTLFAGVKLIAAGTYLRISVGAMSQSPEPRRYWDFSFAEMPGHASRSDMVEELDRLFRQAVTRQLIGDVPVGCYLSGGVDSGSITAIAARQLRDLRTFTVGFDLRSASGLELAVDERAAAEALSYFCKTEHYEMVLKAGDMERCMDALIWHLEEPRVGQCYPNFYAAKLAGKFNKVVLGGTGGDELFGGYPWRYFRAIGSGSFDDYVERYFAYWQRLVPTDLMRALFSPLGEFKEAEPKEIFRSVFRDHQRGGQLARADDYINESLYFEAKTFLHGLLVMEDKLSMAHSLENRVPFLDNDLVDFAMRVPVRHKLNNLDEVPRIDENEPQKRGKYFERTRDGKVILREAMGRHVPQDIATAVKQGFSAPDASWFRGESIEYVRRTLMGKHARIFEYLDRDVVQKLVGDHLEGRANRRLLIWSLLCLETWCAVFMSGSSVQRALAPGSA